MADLKATPGPWAYRPHEFDDWGFVRAPDGGIICQARDPLVLDEEQLVEHRRAKTDPWEANARLIAAAPELYEACNAWIDWLTVEDWREDAADYEAKILERMRAALSRARGPQ